MWHWQSGVKSMLPDNYDLWARHDAEQERARRKLPICSCCEEHIQQEKAVRIDGKWYCDYCLDEMREYIDE